MLGLAESPLSSVAGKASWHQQGVSDLTPYQYWAINASLLVGSLLGGWLYQDHFPLLLALLCGMSVLTFWLSWTRMTETRTGAPATRSEMGLPALLRSYAAVVSDRRFLLFTLGGIAVLSIEFSRSNWIAVHLAEHFHSQLVLGALINGVRASSVLVGLNTLLIVALTAPVTRWIQARVPRPMMNLGFALFALGFSVLAFSTNLPALLIASVVLSMGEMLYVPTRQALLADLIPGERRGAYLAVNGQVFTLAKWVAALGLPIGAVLGAPGMAAIVLGLGVLGILLTSLALLQVPGRRVSPSA